MSTVKGLSKCIAALIACAAILIPFTASGGAVVDFDLPACKPANRTITIDGKLNDWQGIEGKQFFPVHAYDSTTVAEDRPDIAATLRFTYDADALYASIDWLSPKPPSNTSSPTDATNWQKGGDGIVVAQRVPVIAGKKYALRFFRHCDGMKGNEIKTPSKDRGYTSLHSAMDWIGGLGMHTGVISIYEDTGWVENLNTASGNYGLPHTYTAPPGATSVIIAFRAVVNAPDFLPTMAIDDVEFVEMPDK